MVAERELCAAIDERLHRLIPRGRPMSHVPAPVKSNE